MATLAPLSHWENTAHSLHKAAQLLGAIRMLVLDPVPNYLELSLEICPEGLSTSLLPFGGEVILDFRRYALLSRPAAREPAVLPLAGNSQASLLETPLVTLEAQGHRLAARANGKLSRTEALLAALEARKHVFLAQRVART